MRIFFSLFLVAALLSCEPESITEKEVNAKYKSIQRKWQFTSMETVGQGADSVRVELMSASMDWTNKCKYTESSGQCTGPGNFNNLKINYIYGYDTMDGKYLLQVSYDGKYTEEQYILARKLPNLINGKWEFEVTGETFTARQVTNDRLPGVLTTLTAKAL